MTIRLYESPVAESAAATISKVKENLNVMEMSSQEELKAHLIESDPGFRHLAEEHAAYHAQLEALESKSSFTPEDEEEEHRLKKLKLRLKDEMEAALLRAAPIHA